MFRESLLERPDEVLGFVATQLLVPVSTDEPRATRARGWITEVRGVVEGVERRGVVFEAGTVGIRTMLVPEELRPKEEEEPRLEPQLLGDMVIEEPRELDGIMVRAPEIMVRAAEDPREDDPPEEPLNLEGLMDEPREGVLPREELMEPRELLLPRELLPRELL